jgi:hypothetical protein
LIAQAKEWANSLGKPVRLWLSDKQDAFVTGIAAEFPDVPHRYCDNHFLRDLAKPVLEADSHAKFQMRKKVRGLRKIEQAVLKQHAAETSKRITEQEDPQAIVTVVAGLSDTPSPQAESAGAVVLDDCAAVRGILNNDQGGPLHPPGLQMADALDEVRASIQRNLDEKKGVRRRATQPLGRLHRPRSGPSPGRTGEDPRIRQRRQRGSRDPGARRANLCGSPREVRGIDRSIPAH